ncbi:hypothetical protein WN55_07581 [Dufourea novaeangliae]|uniref:Uncharacterized protein n=1 Tax=Dufourea novaeangliae TaxID=178035 RepID=A0A154P2F5_DUFNO|nr:hypothetical protein WN55_07581 [Dufourea novaeangliae]
MDSSSVFPIKVQKNHAGNTPSERLESIPFVLVFLHLFHFLDTSKHVSRELPRKKRETKLGHLFSFPIRRRSLPAALVAGQS